MRYLPEKKDAFTLLELTIVIVILGILAAMAIPRLDRDLNQEAADKTLAAIRYTQHMALNDHKQMFNDPKWQRRFWRIMFAQCDRNGVNEYFYRIGSDDNMDSTSTFERREAATDPLNGKPIYMANNANCDDSTVSDEIFIGKRYGLTVDGGRTGTGCAGLRSIGFDHLGRPHTGFSDSTTPDYSSYMTLDCIMDFSLATGETFSIQIEHETGYSYILGQDAS